MLAEIYGNITVALVVGGSMHLQDQNVGMVSSVPIVSSAMGMATGNALHQKRENLKDITVIYCGDASLEEGIFFECANFASLHSLPIIFACENNLFSVYTNISERQIDSILRNMHLLLKFHIKRLMEIKLTKFIKQQKKFSSV